MPRKTKCMSNTNLGYMLSAKKKKGYDEGFQAGAKWMREEAAKLAYNRSGEDGALAAAIRSIKIEGER